jgi:hypothetical protein
MSCPQASTVQNEEKFEALDPQKSRSNQRKPLGNAADLSQNVAVCRSTSGYGEEIMPRLHPTEKELEQREKRAKVWKKFMEDNLFTEKRLAETIGVSRRTVQMVKAGLVTPHKNTLHLFDSLKSKYDKERKRSKS